MNYPLLIKIYTILEKVLGQQEAETLAVELEDSLKNTIHNSKEIVKSELKDELATKKDLHDLENKLEIKVDSIKSEFNERFKLLDFKLNIVIVISLLALTLFNPALMLFLTKLFKL